MESRAREGYFPEQIRNEAFQSIQNNLTERQKEVYNIILKWQPISNECIAGHLNLYPHQVTPRTLELREMGIIEYAGESVSALSRRKVALWRINPNGRQLNLF
jgi:predicted transcriptional regulator